MEPVFRKATMLATSRATICTEANARFHIYPDDWPPCPFQGRSVAPFVVSFCGVVCSDVCGAAFVDLAAGDIPAR